MAKEPSPKKASAKKASAKKASAKDWPARTGTIEDVIGYQRAALGTSEPDRLALLATGAVAELQVVRAMELARSLARLGQLAEANELSSAFYCEGVRCFALAEASLRAPDVAIARKLAEDAVFDWEECTEAKRPRVSAAMLYLALRRLDDPRAEARIPEVRTAAARPAGILFADLGRLVAVATRHLLDAGETELAIELCKTMSVAPSCQRALVGHVLSRAPAFIPVLLDQQHRTDSEIRRWPLMWLGQAELAGAGKYRDAIAWLEKVQGYRMDAHRAVVERAFAAEAPEAWTLWDEAFSASANESFEGRAKWLLMGAKVDARRVREAIEAEILLRSKIDLGRSFELVATLAEAAVRAGVERSALERYGAAKLGALRGTDPLAPEWTGLLTEAEAWVLHGLHPRTKVSERIGFEWGLALVEVLARVGRLEESRALAERLPRAEGKLEVVDLGATLATQARAGDLKGAYETWKSITKSQRTFYVHALLDACVNQRAISEFVAVLSELPSEPTVGIPMAAYAIEAWTQ